MALVSNKKQRLRIFQNKTAPEIIEDVFRRNRFSQFDLRLYGEFPKREYCVQYRESDFTFVSRLMEEEGVYYFFAHEQGKHTLVLANQPAAHQPCPVNPLKWHDGTRGSSYRKSNYPVGNNAACAHRGDLADRLQSTASDSRAGGHARFRKALADSRLSRCLSHSGRGRADRQDSLQEQVSRKW